MGLVCKVVQQCLVDDAQGITRNGKGKGNTAPFLSPLNPLLFSKTEFHSSSPHCVWFRTASVLTTKAHYTTSLFRQVLRTYQQGDF